MTNLRACPLCGDRAVERQWPEGVGAGVVGCLGYIDTECPLVDVDVPLAKWDTYPRRADEPAAVIEFTPCDECDGFKLIKGPEDAHGWHKPIPCPVCSPARTSGD